MNVVRGLLLGFFGSGAIINIMGQHGRSYPPWIDIVGLIILCLMSEFLLIREKHKR